MALLGPTASGKSHLALAAAKALEDAQAELEGERAEREEAQEAFHR